MPKHIDCTLEEYHARPEWSHSQLEVLLQSVPLFHGRFITGIYPRRESDVFDDGTIVHHILTGGNLDDIVAIIPDEGVLNADGHRKGKAWKDWESANEGKILRKASECDPLFRMIESVRNHAKAAWLLDGDGYFEHSIIWVDQDSWLPLRARPDRIARLSDGTVVLADIKTTRAMSPREFASDAARYGYHRQAAHYRDGARQIGMEVAAFVFIAVDKTPAHETHCYQLHEADIELGASQNRVLYHELAKRLETNNWTAPDHGEILELGLPEWAYRENQWRTA